MAVVYQRHDLLCEWIKDLLALVKLSAISFSTEWAAVVINISSHYTVVIREHAQCNMTKVTVSESDNISKLRALDLI